MEIITEGHCYELSNFDKPLEKGQTLQFIHKAPASENSKEVVTIADGTTNEEVIDVLINRLIYLQAKFPCDENVLAITKLKEANFWLHERTRNRVKRGVEGEQMS